MVKIAARTITLNVFKLNYKPATDYICTYTARPFFLDLVSQIHEMKFKISNIIGDLYENEMDSHLGNLNINSVNNQIFKELW